MAAAAAVSHLGRAPKASRSLRSNKQCRPQQPRQVRQPFAPPTHNHQEWIITTAQRLPAQYAAHLPEDSRVHAAPTPLACALGLSSPSHTAAALLLLSAMTLFTSSAPRQPLQVPRPLPGGLCIIT
jgi:hypothetical protein